ncbi:hypothetical protein [Proteiniclasticum sp.]|uniref:hypothetical protein n=1 Tax=Proteiniclasticum sp. TaxID=2053595 RepID=UPI0028987901|nr:hypothetical protein [Proteiniclasticum sp.]
MQTIYSCIHDIDIDGNQCIRKEVNQKDASDYTQRLINEILGNPNRKEYKITSERTEVVSIVLEASKQSLIENDNADLIALRLLDKERDRQKDVNRLRIEIRRGSLFQSLIQEDDHFYYVITKIENVDILDIQDLYKKSGLPYENKSFKNCLFKIADDGEIIQIFLSDKNGPIADYWDNLFLELEALSSDESNTESLFRIVSAKLKKEIEKISPTDYTLYRNQALGFFKTQEKFTIDDFLNYTFGNQNPESSQLDIDKIKESISKKIIDSGTDTEFTIVSSAIKSRKFRETKKINNVASIIIDGYDEEIKTNVQSVEENGDKYIRIKSTDLETFNRFKW